MAAGPRIGRADNGFYRIYRQSLVRIFTRCIDFFRYPHSSRKIHTPRFTQADLLHIITYKTVIYIFFGPFSVVSYAPSEGSFLRYAYVDGKTVCSLPDGGADDHH